MEQIKFLTLARETRSWAAFVNDYANKCAVDGAVLEVSPDHSCCECHSCRHSYCNPPCGQECSNPWCSPCSSPCSSLMRGAHGPGPHFASNLATAARFFRALAARYNCSTAGQTLYWTAGLRLRAFDEAVLRVFWGGGGGVFDESRPGDLARTLRPLIDATPVGAHATYAVVAPVHALWARIAALCAEHGMSTDTLSSLEEGEIDEGVSMAGPVMFRHFFPRS